MGYRQWQPDGSGVRPGGDCGGVFQAGDSFSVRYVRPDIRGALITRTAYPLRCGSEYTVQVKTEWLICTDPADPGGTEVWSDESYDDSGTGIYPSASAAEAAASQLAARLIGDAGTHDWDGQPC